MFLVQGVFFQLCGGLGTSWNGGDLQAVWRTQFRFFVFHGVFGRQPDEPQGELSGETCDEFGEAEISNIRLSDAELRFDKKYKTRPNEPIEYIFRKQMDWAWEGVYEGVYCDPAQNHCGNARCVLVEVPDDFLSPPPEAIAQARAEFQGGTDR